MICFHIRELGYSTTFAHVGKWSRWKRITRWWMLVERNEQGILYVTNEEGVFQCLELFQQQRLNQRAMKTLLFCLFMFYYF